jgi:hypothetical protein
MVTEKAFGKVLLLKFIAFLLRLSVICNADTFAGQWFDIENLLMPTRKYRCQLNKFLNDKQDQSPYKK